MPTMAYLLKCSLVQGGEVGVEKGLNLNLQPVVWEHIKKYTERLQNRTIQEQNFNI